MILIKLSILISLILLPFVERSQLKRLYYFISTFIKTKFLSKVTPLLKNCVIAVRRNFTLNRLDYVFKRLSGQWSKKSNIDLDFWEYDLKVGDFVNEDKK